VKVAVLSDIHANLPALQAVLEDLPPVDARVVCGDLVGYYPDADPVCDLLRGLDAHVIRGNHDAYVIGALAPAAEHAAAYKTAWTQAHLSAPNRRWLEGLPVELGFRWDGLKVSVRHASPWDEESYLYADSPRLAEVVLQHDEMLLLGHTHHPMQVAAGAGRILNPGSVGQPRDWNPLASYAVLDTRARTAQLRRVAYDVGAFQARLRALGWDAALIDILGRKRG
jgi:putative phosphoesterase